MTLVSTVVRNKAAARAVFEVWSGGDPQRLDEFVAVDVVHHDPYDPHAREGLDGMKATIRRNRGVFPDLCIVVEDQVAEEDRVATRWTAVMTHLGTLTGEPPTGRTVRLAGTTIDRLEDGKIVEAWRSMDTLHLFREIGTVLDRRRT